VSSEEYAITLEIPEDVYVLALVFAEQSGQSLEEFALRAIKRELLDAMDSTN
jgi:hypothetical protein